MLATVFASFTSTSIGSYMTSVDRARHLSWPIASLTAGDSTFGALTTTFAATCVPGNAAFMRLYVCKRFCGYVSMLALAVWSWTAGTARATSTPAARAADRAGRRSTRSMIAPQKRPSPSSRRNRCTNGTRSRSTLSPSFESNAGRTVSEPSIATATTVIVAAPNDAKSESPVRNMPAIATMTVLPEMSTERPDVAAAASRAASSLRPLARSSRSRFK